MSVAEVFDEVEHPGEHDESDDGGVNCFEESFLHTCLLLVLVVLGVEGEDVSAPFAEDLAGVLVLGGLAPPAAASATTVVVPAQEPETHQDEDEYLWHW